MLFSSSDVAEMRAIERANMPHTCEFVTRRAIRSPGSGGRTQYTAWDVDESRDAVPCRVVRSLVSRERNLRDSTVHEHETDVVMPAGTIVGPHDRLRVTGVDPEGREFAQEFEITGVVPTAIYETRRIVHVRDAGLVVEITSHNIESMLVVSLDYSTPLAVRVKDRSGHLVSRFPVKFSALAPTLARVDETVDGDGVRTYSIRGLRRGETTIVARAGSAVTMFEISVGLDPRVVLAEAAVTFNIPGTPNAYAPEKLILNPVPGSAWKVGRFTRESASPGGASFEEWALKSGGDPNNDDDYYPVFSLMTANFFSIAFGPRTGVQVRARSGGNAGVVRVNALAAQLEPVLDEQTVTFNMSGNAGEYANEHMTFRTIGGILIGSIAVMLESVVPTGTVLDSWVLRPGGDVNNPAHYLPTGVNFLAGSALGGNPVIMGRTVRLRAKSGSVAGSFTMHGICSRRTGLVL